MAQDKSDILVIGAGVVGMACAVTLQAAGFKVTVLDRDEPGMGCSYGNAGHFATEQVFPLAAPGLWREVPGMLLDPVGPLRLRLPYAPRLARWLALFLQASSPVRFAAGTHALRQLTAPALDAFAPLIARAGLDDLMVRRGNLLVFETERGFAAGKAEARDVIPHGVPAQVVEARDLYELEPALAPGLAGGVMFPATAHTLDPWQLVLRLVDGFLRDGGRLERAGIAALSQRADGVEARSNDGRFWQAKQAVVAAGVWSKELAACFGHRVPLEAERGYHLMLPQPGVWLNRPVASGERRFIMTPMADGLRLAGTVELASREASPDYRRSAILLTNATRLLPGIDGQGGTPWMGCRPTLPDYMPVIGRDPAAAGILWAFGHQHLGLTLAGITGQIVGALAQGREPEGIDLTPFRIGRFR